MRKKLIRCSKCKKVLHKREYKKGFNLIRGKIVCKECYELIKKDNLRHLFLELDIPNSLKILEDEDFSSLKKLKELNKPKFVISRKYNKFKLI